MDILITGGCGFLGSKLARTLLQKGTIRINGESSQPIRKLILTDLVPPAKDLQADQRVQFIAGNLRTLLLTEKIMTAEIKAVFHLAAAVSGECEANFDLGMASNFETTRDLLQACRTSQQVPSFIFASSVAVFSSRPGQSWQGIIVDDDTLPTPQSSYGIQKYIGEQLVADFGRKGFIRARAVRLMTVSVRPGNPNGAASGFLSGMIREPLAGLKAIVPVDPETPVALASPARTIEGLIKAAETADSSWGFLTAMNLPSLRVTVGDMARTLLRLGGPHLADRLDWKIDPAIVKLVNSWPGEIAYSRASQLGLTPDLSFDAIVQQYINENPTAIQLR
ncbi:WcaG Nucleoside-diphosphate-sugar epimerases [Burkholderiaceae bacterium]|jgi:nucleoside-diphosphate-sugar epimerase